MAYFKKFLLINLLLFAFLSKAYAEVVNKIEVEGNDRITIETIAIFGDVSIGKNYETSDVKLLIKKLYETNFFSNISVELVDGVLKIIVKENPIIREIIFKGEKAIKYQDQIKELITLKEKTPFMKNFVKSDINLIKEIYRSLGYYFIKIDLDIEEIEKNRVNLVYTLDKGDKAKISKIYFLGEKKIREKKLRDIITSQEAKFWKFISRNVYLSKNRVALDKRLLKNYYKNKGYYEVDISSSNVEYAEGEGFVLTYTINAGKRYRFKKVSANISEALDKTAFSSLEKSFNEIAGEYYSQYKLTSILEEIDELSEQKELQFINHSISETLDGDGVDVVINVFEGQKFTIERINIVGNSVTNDAVIRGEMIIDEGDPYSVLLINKSINKLKARGIFGKIEKEIKEGSSSDLKVLEIKVEEKATGEITAGAGVGTDGTAFMAAISENNWLGRGINLRTSLDVTEETISGSLAVTNPNYNYSGNEVSGSLDVSSSDKTTNSGYKSSKTGLSMGTKFEQYQDIFLAPNLSFSYEDIEAESTASAQMKKMEGDFTNVDFLYSVILDKRNQPFQPTKGYRTKFIQSLPLVWDTSSIMNGFDISAYKALSEDVITSVKFSARSVNGLEDEDVRLTNRLFIAPKQLRGFNTRKVGPKDGEDWIGGNYTTSLGFETRLPNLLPESYRTDFSLFFDNANVWSVDYSSSIDDTNEIRSSVGIAANVWTTIGPLSFTLAQDLAKSVNDDTELFNFRLGTSF